MRSSIRRSDGRQRPRAIARARRGFSILELTVVLIMMSIVAGMAIPRVNYQRYRADAAMRSVRTVLQGAERNAIMRQTDVVVGFDVAGKRLVILEDANNNCTADNGERVSVRPLEEGAQFKLPSAAYPNTSPSSAVSGSNLCTMKGYPSVQFLRDGAASTDVDVYITSGRAAVGDYRMVRVLQAGGRTETYRYSGTAWGRYN
ncbi:MAG: type II secretion system protein [Gemmatimonadaceae bacterium]